MSKKRKSSSNGDDNEGSPPKSTKHTPPPPFPQQMAPLSPAASVIFDSTQSRSPNDPRAGTPDNSWSTSFDLPTESSHESDEVVMIQEVGEVSVQMEEAVAAESQRVSVNIESPTESTEEYGEGRTSTSSSSREERNNESATDRLLYNDYNNSSEESSVTREGMSMTSAEIASEGNLNLAFLANGTPRRSDLAHFPSSSLSTITFASNNSTLASIASVMPSYSTSPPMVQNSLTIPETVPMIENLPPNAPVVLSDNSCRSNNNPAMVFVIHQSSPSADYTDDSVEVAESNLMVQIAPQIETSAPVFQSDMSGRSNNNHVMVIDEMPPQEAYDPDVDVHATVENQSSIDESEDITQISTMVTQVSDISLAVTQIASDISITMDEEETQVGSDSDDATASSISSTTTAAPTPTPQPAPLRRGTRIRKQVDRLGITVPPPHPAVVQVRRGRPAAQRQPPPPPAAAPVRRARRNRIVRGPAAVPVAAPPPPVPRRVLQRVQVAPPPPPTQMVRGYVTVAPFLTDVEAAIGHMIGKDFGREGLEFILKLKAIRTAARSMARRNDATKLQVSLV